MAYQKLAEAMIHPLTKGNGAAHRPALIHFEDEALMEAVRPLLAELEVKVFYQTQRRGIDEIVKDLEKSLAMFGEGNIPGLLQLNPKDNQGVRYLLLDLLIDLGKDEQARALLNEYQDDWSARFAYATALLALREQGDSREANQALTKAIGKNAHVLQYLTGAKQIPMEGPKIISMGGEDEAVDYAREQFDFWRKTPGAIDWLKNKVSAEPKRKKK